MNTNIDCPLCGLKDCITQSPRTTKTVTRPGPKKNYGRSHIAHVGGEWDYSHADVCPKLTDAFKKRELLEYHVTDRQTIKEARNAVAYQLALHQIYYSIVSKNILNLQNCEWTVEIFIKRNGLNNDEILLTKALTPQEAFESLRCRILCGEIWELGGEKFQFLPTTLDDNDDEGLWRIYLNKLTDGN